jgi:hypothetical protein
MKTSTLRQQSHLAVRTGLGILLACAIPAWPAESLEQAGIEFAPVKAGLQVVK